MGRLSLFYMIGLYFRCCKSFLHLTAPEGNPSNSVGVTLIYTLKWMHIISWHGCTMIYSAIQWEMGSVWFIDYLFLRKRVAERSLILQPNEAVLIYHLPPSPPQVSTQVCWYLEFRLFPLNLNPRGSQYVILMGSEAFKNGIQTFWAVSKGDDFLLNGINLTNPVWNLINTSDKGRTCRFSCEMEGAFCNKMCLASIWSSETREGPFPGVLMDWGAGEGGGPCRAGQQSLPRGLRAEAALPGSPSQSPKSSATARNQQQLSLFDCLKLFL